MVDAEKPVQTMEERRNRKSSSKVSVSFRNIYKSFGEVQVLKGIDLDIRQGEFFSLLGPSGCGKTTLLRILAGFEDADEGTLLLEGQEISQLPPNKRSVNTVFQNYALFPHMTVFENVAFGLKMRRVAEQDRKNRVYHALTMVEIERFAERKPEQLSGGQRQRVALARAIVNEPKVLLLDEPLSALDRKLRQQLQLELVHLQLRLGITFIFVTHDQEEALSMSDRIAVMHAGTLEQLGTAEDVYEHPKSAYVAKFLGTSNVLESTVIELAGFEVGRIRTSFGELEVTDTLPKHGDVLISIRPEKIQLSQGSYGDKPNQIPVQVIDEIYSGEGSRYRLQADGGVVLEVSWLNRKVAGSHFNIGERLIAHLPPEALVVLESKSHVGPDELVGPL
jgi:spermidine/putrescine transport system ATP-binding protein